MKYKILSLLKELGEMSVFELSERLEISRQMLHRHLKKLIENNQVTKIGKSPKVYYRFVELINEEEIQVSISYEEKKFIENYFIQITENGKLLVGIKAFSYWCKKRDLPIKKTALEFIKTKKRYLKYNNPYGLIDGTNKLLNTKGFNNIGLKKLFYSDFYAIERFGKTKLGQMLLYAKQGQDKSIIKQIVNLVSEDVKRIIIENNIDAIGFIPPSIKREIQFMKEFERYLNINIPLITIEKVQTDIIIPQKTLSKLADRIANAKSNIVITERRSFDTILLIDDAVGSGATLVETSKKVIKRKVAKTVFGYAVTGSFKGFDVISEA
jgi:DNA-binding transcriptional ArsR family regulator